MNKLKILSLTAGLVLAAAFTLSCSGDDPEDGGGGLNSGSNLSDVPKQLYIITEGDDAGYDDNHIVREKEKYEGNGDIKMLLRNYKEDLYDTLPAGKIQNGQMVLDLPKNVDKYLWKSERILSSCYDNKRCQTTVSLVPENFNFLESDLYLDVIISGKSNCWLFLIRSGETRRVYFYYFSESGKITGTETWKNTWDDGERKTNFDINFSKGWNLVVNEDDYYMTTNLPKGSEWGLRCW